MTWCSEVSASPGLCLASSAIHRRFVDRFAGLMSLPLFPVDSSLLAAPPFPPSGPGKPGSPLSAVLRRRYDFPSAYRRSLICFVSTVHGYLLLRVRRSAPARSEVSCRPGPWYRLPVAPVSLTWTRMGPLRSSGDPSCAFAPFQDPGRANVSSPLSDTLMLPPLSIRRGPRRYLISGLTRSFSTRYRTLHACVAAHVQGSLPASGLRLCREGFEPSGSLRKVSVRWFDDHPPFLLS